MSTKNVLTEHLDDIGESYFEHLRFASGFGIRMIWAGIACLFHALLPFAFVNTGSKCISTLHDDMVANRHKLSERQGTTRAV